MLQVFKPYFNQNYHDLIAEHKAESKALACYAIKVDECLREKLAVYAVEIADQLCKKHKQQSVIQIDRCQSSLLPDTLTIDFAVVSVDGGKADLKLIEAQAYAATLHAMLDFEEEAGGGVLGGLTVKQRKSILDREILGNFKPNETIMLSHDINKLSTKFDFTIAKKSIEPLSLGDLFIEDGKLFYIKDGIRQCVKRIYSRIILSDLNTDELHFFRNILSIKDVSWFNHYTWYHKINKSHINDISHKAKLRQYSLDEAGALNLENTVLKAKDGHSGSGVIVSPSYRHLSGIDKDAHFLQEKVSYAECFTPPLSNKPHKIELRCALLLDRTKNTFVPIMTMGRVSLSGMISETMRSPSEHEGAALVLS